ncbi:wd repeat-containing protein [Anaeramoeba flamelloides]|uniref:Wd repeat-containing protein n=1 Tax=Anaeramoeba flamelloides TaxID=1746091 RepID=A0AAV7YAT9_9EUKA|nr:wd repeat-containing protein [Anaeramoeba flamelloides]
MNPNNHPNILIGSTSTENTSAIDTNFNLLVFGCQTNVVVYDLEKQNIIHILQKHTKQVTQIQICPTSLSFETLYCGTLYCAVSGDTDGNCVLWNLSSGKPLFVIKNKKKNQGVPIIKFSWLKRFENDQRTEYLLITRQNGKFELYDFSGTSYSGKERLNPKLLWKRNLKIDIQDFYMSSASPQKGFVYSLSDRVTVFYSNTNLLKTPITHSSIVYKLIPNLNNNSASFQIQKQIKRKNNGIQQQQQQQKQQQQPDPQQALTPKQKRKQKKKQKQQQKQQQNLNQKQTKIMDANKFHIAKNGIIKIYSYPFDKSIIFILCPKEFFCFDLKTNKIINSITIFSTPEFNMIQFSKTFQSIFYGIHSTCGLSVWSFNKEKSDIVMLGFSSGQKIFHQMYGSSLHNLSFVVNSGISDVLSVIVGNGLILKFQFPKIGINFLEIEKNCGEVQEKFNSENNNLFQLIGMSEFIRKKPTCISIISNEKNNKNLLAIGNKKGILQIYDLNTFEVVQSLKIFYTTITGLIWINEECVIAYTDKPNKNKRTQALDSICLIDLESGINHFLQILEAKVNDSIKNIYLSPKKRYLAIIFSSNHYGIYDLFNLNNNFSYSQFKQSIQTFSWDTSTKLVKREQYYITFQNDPQIMCYYIFNNSIVEKSPLVIDRNLFFSSSFIIQNKDFLFQTVNNHIYHYQRYLKTLYLIDFNIRKEIRKVIIGPSFNLQRIFFIWKDQTFSCFDIYKKQEILLTPNFNKLLVTDICFYSWDIVYFLLIDGSIKIYNFKKEKYKKLLKRRKNEKIRNKIKNKFSHNRENTKINNIDNINKTKIILNKIVHSKKSNCPIFYHPKLGLALKIFLQFDFCNDKKVNGNENINDKNLKYQDIEKDNNKEQIKERERGKEEKKKKEEKKEEDNYKNKYKYKDEKDEKEKDEKEIEEIEEKNNKEEREEEEEEEEEEEKEIEETEEKEEEEEEEEDKEEEEEDKQKREEIFENAVLNEIRNLSQDFLNEISGCNDLISKYILIAKYFDNKEEVFFWQLLRKFCLKIKKKEEKMERKRKIKEKKIQKKIQKIQKKIEQFNHKIISFQTINYYKGYKLKKKLLKIKKKIYYLETKSQKYKIINAHDKIKELMLHLDNIVNKINILENIPKRLTEMIKPNLIPQSLELLKSKKNLYLYCKLKNQRKYSDNTPLEHMFNKAKSLNELFILDDKQKVLSYFVSKLTKNFNHETTFSNILKSCILHSRIDKKYYNLEIRKSILKQLKVNFMEGMQLLYLFDDYIEISNQLMIRGDWKQAIIIAKIHLQQYQIQQIISGYITELFSKNNYWKAILFSISIQKFDLTIQFLSQINRPDLCLLLIKYCKSVKIKIWNKDHSVLINKITKQFQLLIQDLGINIKNKNKMI